MKRSLETCTRVAPSSSALHATLLRAPGANHLCSVLDQIFLSSVHQSIKVRDSIKLDGWTRADVTSPERIAYILLPDSQKLTE